MGFRVYKIYNNIITNIIYKYITIFNIIGVVPSGAECYGHEFDFKLSGCQCFKEPAQANIIIVLLLIKIIY